MLYLNPEYADAPYELTFIDRSGKAVGSLKEVALRFSEANISAAVKMLKSGDIKKLATIAVPIFLENPSS